MAKLQFATLSNLTEFLSLHNVQIDAKISEAVKSSIKTVSQSADGFTLYFYKKTAPVTIEDAVFTITLPKDSAKADKVTGAVNGHLAGLDADGNLVDSGKSAADFDEAGAATQAKSEVMTYVGTIPANAVYLPAQSGTIITSATIGGQSVNYANSAGKLSTSRTISLTGSVTGSGNFDGSGNLTISTATSHTHNSVTDINSGATTTFAYSKAGMGYGDFTWLAAWNGSELRAVNKSLFATAGHTHTNIVSRGRKNPCASGTTGNNANAEVNVAGLSLTEAYSASTPTSFGNIINVIGAGAGGAGQLFLGWSGADSVTEHLYYRSHRDTTTGGWGPWRTVAFTTDNVASADTLTSNAGSATQPIYFSGGKPVACSYSLSKSVPSNAVFTDTNTWRGCQNNLTSTATDQSLSAAQGKWLNENKLNAINTNGYWGMATPSGNSGDWIRTTSAGIIPYQPGGINSSHCGIGTSSWYFNCAYITTVYGNLSGNASTASKLATARTVSGGTDITMSFNYDGSGNSDANIGFYNCSAYVSNTNNYPFHRFAKLDVIPDSWADKTTTFYVSQDFNGGAFGIFRISLRTNNVSNKELASAEVVWLVRHGIPADAIQIGLYNVAGATYADAFIKTQGSYYSTVFRAIANGVRGTISRTWTLINSSENGNTSSSDKKGSYECYASVAAAGTALHNKSYTNIVSGSDVGNVSTASYASSAGNATQWNGRTLDIGTEAGSDAGWLLIDNGGIVRHRSASYFATSGHTHNYAGSSSAGGSANWANGASYANYAIKTQRNPTEDKTTDGLFMFQYDSNTTFNPDNGWWSLIRTQHPGYSNGYWQEIALSFHDDRLMFRRNVNGSKTAWKQVAWTDHTHNYAGSGSAGGSANSAVKLDSSAGSATQPIYFSGGKPAACSYTINASVPSGAKFTDTNTWRGIQNNLSSDSTTDSLSAAQGKKLKNIIDEKTDIHNLNYGIKFSSSRMDSNDSQNTL